MKTLDDHIKPILALIIILFGFAFFLICQFSHEKPDPQIIIAIVGLMGTAAGYYFGASTGTSKKDETISELAKK